MKKVILVAAFAALTATAHAAGCLVFDATAPKKLADGSAVYPLSDVFPKVVPIANCTAASGLISDTSKFTAVDVSPTCHPILVKRVKNIMARREGEDAPVYTTAGLFTDGKGNCGPLAVAAAQSTKASNWTGY